MPESIPVDLFATKGIEYILVIGFLFALLIFWQVLRRPVPAEIGAVAATAGRGASAGWFRLAAGAFYHPGHSWVMPEAEDIVTIGIDDFAQKLVGEVTQISLPEAGKQLSRGEPGWQIEAGSQAVELLAPLDGEVVERNRAVLASPALVNSDPYGEGWLLKVRPSRLKSDLKGLLSGRLAQNWMRLTEQALRSHMSGDLGTVLQDGGLPVSGIARALSGEQWDEFAREFLLTD
jgi:glycine cleavage system H lipoate-binding protein